MSLGNQDVDKLVKAIENGVVVFKAVKSAKEDDGKISYAEIGAMAVAHAGKAWNFVSNIKEIGEEIVDIEADEASEISTALTSGFSANNPYAAPGATQTIAGIAALKEGMETLIKAYAWEEEEVEDATEE